ncbi:spore coat U domain-containing protein [Utexia brackfieldae]|uniref:Csu type fimbrial protein n=1 Tax=Utexia brackfieldae TaxID=3074108 RepID=UPI00370DD4FB
MKKIIQRIVILTSSGSNLIKLCLLLLLYSITNVAYAATCAATTTSGGTLSYGSASSISIQTAQRATSTSNAGLQCGGALLSLLGQQYVRATINTTNKGLLKNSQGDSIPYQIYADANYQNEIVPGTTFYYLTPSLIDLLGLFGGNTKNIPMYFRTQTGTYNLRADTYTDTISVTWQWYFCSISITPLICINPTSGATTWTAVLSLTVTNDCIINAPDINFGSKPLATLFPSVSQSVSVYCTKGSTYSIGLNNGSNALGQQRRLAFNGNFLNYEIYQGNSGTLRWGTLAAERRSSANADVNPGSGSGVSSSTQGFVYRAMILPNQTTPPAGTYTDTIIIDVAF